MRAKITEFSDANTFLARAQAFLTFSEAENNLLLSSSLAMARASTPRHPRLTFHVAEERGEIRCAALNLEQRKLLLSVAAPESAALLGARLRERGIGVRGVFGPSPAAQAFCETYRSPEGFALTHGLEQRAMRLQNLRENARASGGIRLAKDRDLKLLLRWTQQFVDECDLDESLEETELVVRRSTMSKQLFVWENDGQPVAMGGFGGITPNGVRVNMVYTDPNHRGRGFAGSLVSMLSRQLLDQGHRYCFLFAEKANVAANKAYEKLGYEALGDISEIRASRELALGSAS